MNTQTAPAKNRRSAKVLVPLATLLVAGAVAVGSGASFTSTSGNTISAVTSGSLTQSNSKAGDAIFELDNIKPGDVVNGSLTLTNTGTLPAEFSLTENRSVNGFTDEMLTLVVTDTTNDVEVYNGNFGGLVDGARTALGQIAPGASNNFTFTVALDANATNTEQSKTASADYAWDSVQLDGSTTNQ